MTANLQEIFRRLQSGAVSKEELEELYQRHRQEYRVLFHLTQHPQFPVPLALEVVARLLPVDLVRLSKSKRSNPFVRKRAEIEFSQRYQRIALGEKISLLKTAPASLLELLVEETQPRLIETMLQNPYCTEEIIIRFVNRKKERFTFYQALDRTSWHSNPAVALAIAHDAEAPIKMLVKIIPFLSMDELQQLYSGEHTHLLVRQKIQSYLAERNKTSL